MVSYMLKIKKGDKHLVRKTLEASSSASFVLLIMGPVSMTRGNRHGRRLEKIQRWDFCEVF